MAGAVILVIALVIVLPVLVIMSGAVAAGLLGSFLSVDADASAEGSELVELSR